MYKTYVMHYKPLRDRKEFILKQLSSKGIENFEFITDFDKDVLTEKIIEDYYLEDEEKHFKECQVSMRQGEKYQFQKMKYASISLCIKHVEAFEKTKQQEEDFALFLEDDCRFHQDSTSLEEIISKAPQDWDAIVIGGPFKHDICQYNFIVGDDNSAYLKAKHPATNTTSSILYRKSTAEKIMPYVKPFSLPIDWQLNFAFWKAKLNVYHIYPYISTQGDFKSTAND
jgi:GR25 family glycosyltransferase involved in LPS biosynthesis